MVNKLTNYFKLENHIYLANATGIKSRSLSPSFLSESISEMFFLKILPVNYRAEGGEK